MFQCLFKNINNATVSLFNLAALSVKLLINKRQVINTREREREAFIKIITIYFNIFSFC
jgi:hypothetical protein